MRKFTVGLLAYLLISLISRAQGFNILNGRNHPEIQWKVAETPHFRIMYPAHLEGIESKGAAIAEASYRVLAQNLDVSFGKKIRIYLSDEDEISNGFAVPIGDSYTDIWVNVNDYIDTWTGDVKWLRKVMAHELTHIFHYHAVHGNIGMWQYLIADPLPRFWTEGLAQYETEKWDSQRGDRWLRAAVFNDKMDYKSGLSYNDGRLLYAVGNSQLRYFTSLYGDSSIVKLLKDRDSFLGLFKYHDFYSSFLDVTNTSYDSFYDDWRKHINIYYNTLASTMSRVDSLGDEPEDLPGQYYFDAKYSPNQQQIAVLSLTSLQRPVRRLYLVQNDSGMESEILADGHINSDIRWNSSGTKIIYSRLTRGVHSSLLNDVFIYDLKMHREYQITHSRRASYPVFGPDGKEVVFIVNEGDVSNIILKDLSSGKEQRITSYAEDVQLMDLSWNYIRDELVFVRFDSTGNRNIVICDLGDHAERIIDSGDIDNRNPLISPDGQHLVFTSLRDEVPNVFIYDLHKKSSHRISDQFTGAEIFDWIPASDSAHAERLLLKTSEKTDQDYAWLVEYSQKTSVSISAAPIRYARWRRRHPPLIIPKSIQPDSLLIEKRYRYCSFSNITHVLSFGVPYYAGTDNYGLAGFTSWAEPLGKHLITGGGWFSLKNPLDSYGVLNYINNQWYPTLAFSLYHLPMRGQVYGSDIWVDMLSGGEVSAIWPVDWFREPYRNDKFGIRLRHVFIDPSRWLKDFDKNAAAIVDPESRRQTDLQLSWITKKQRPYADNIIHPLDGYGIRLMLTGSEKILASNTEYLTSDISAYTILPGIGLQRLFVYGRFQMQYGRSLPQDFIGFSRYGTAILPTPYGKLFLPLNKVERVRGYRTFVAGKEVAFGSLEYRMPFLPSLDTAILGFLHFGASTIDVFADAGAVWDVETGEEGSTEKRLGMGIELKNAVRLGPLKFLQSIGVGQAYDKLFSDSNMDVYYRLRAAVPF